MIKSFIYIKIIDMIKATSQTKYSERWVICLEKNGSPFHSWNVSRGRVFQNLSEMIIFISRLS